MNLDWIGAGLGIALAVAGSRWFVPWLAVRYGFRPEAVRGPASIPSSGRVLRDLARVQRSMESERQALAGFDDSRYEGVALAVGFGIGFAIAVGARVITADGHAVSAFSTAPGAVLLAFAIPDAGLAFIRPHRRADTRMGRSLYRLGLGAGFMVMGIFAGGMAPPGGRFT
ncbi:MAG: hypothetical protein M0R73_03005 [Dehalococcoidia bacterium]|nr:hypothetical protein [Dehalococcoidia bacterium]